MQEAIGTAGSPKIRQFKRHQHLFREGQAPEMIYRVEDGWACRYQMLSANRRQITGLFLPGEFCEPHWLFRPECTKPIVALTTLRVSSFALNELSHTASHARQTRRDIHSEMLGVLGRQADWIATLGRKSAVERVCALLSDIVVRMRSNGHGARDRCSMPLTQTDMADVVGMTPVHVNRVLKQLRSQGLLELRSRWLCLRDPDAIFGIGAGQSLAGHRESALEKALALHSP